MGVSNVLRVSFVGKEASPAIPACLPLIFRSRQSKTQLFVKRTLDIFLSALALVLLSPLLLFLSIRTALSSKGPVLYRQTRIGHKQRPFILYKFRSMYPDAEANGPQLSHIHDVRVTAWGRTMRSFHLDELPQLWNVLRGEMSLVGPRPERLFYIEQIRQTHPQYLYLLDIRPGLTSAGIVHFGYAQNICEMIQRMDYDLKYLQNPTLKTNFFILMQTFKTILRAKIP